MSKLKSCFASLWVLACSFFYHASEFITLGGEAGAARTTSVAATGTAAGTGLGLLSLRGCRSAGSAVEMASTTATRIGRSAAALSEGAAVGRASTIPRAYRTLEGLESAAANPSKWSVFSISVKETQAAKGIAEEELYNLWNRDPLFRAKVLREIAKTHPNELQLLYNRMLIPYPVAAPSQDALYSMTARAVQSEPVILYDASGKPLSGGIAKTAEAMYREKALQVFDDLLKEIPPSSYKSEADLKFALKKALESSRRGEYNFEVTSGKLEIKIKTTRGEIKGEINAYRVITKLAVSGAGLYAGAKLLPGEAAPKPPAPPDSARTNANASPGNNSNSAQTNSNAAKPRARRASRQKTAVSESASPR